MIRSAAGRMQQQRRMKEHRPPTSLIHTRIMYTWEEGEAFIYRCALLASFEIADVRGNFFSIVYVRDVGEGRVADTMML